MMIADIPELFTRLDVVRPGHFLRASGRHTNYYVQCAHLFEDAKSTAEACQLIADHFRDDGIQLVVSPAIGGIIPGYEVSRQLGVRNVYVERRDNVMVLRRGFAFAPGTRVLVLEDEVTTGTSVRDTVELVRAQGGVVVGVTCFVDKSGGKVAFDVPFYPLMNLNVENHGVSTCPLCAQNKPLDNV